MISSVKIRDKMYEPGAEFVIGGEPYTLVKYNENDYGYCYNGAIIRNLDGDLFRAVFWSTMTEGEDILEVNFDEVITIRGNYFMCDDRVLTTVFGPGTVR